MIYINWDPINKFVFWGYFTIHVYSIMFFLSFLIGWYIMKYIYELENISIKYLDLLLIYTTLGTIIGARCGQIFFYDFSYFSDHWIEAFFPIKEKKTHILLGIIKGYEFVGFRGLSSHGATIGIIISSFLYIKQVIQKPFFWLTDRLCIVISLSAFFIRIGNFFNSEIVGKPSNLPWSVIFYQMDSVYGSSLIPRHPTQIYESIIYFFVFLLLCIFFFIKRYQYIVGYLSGLFFTIVWSFRFILEFLKESQHHELINNDIILLNTAQWLSIPCIIFGMILLLIIKQNKKFFS
ncbi:prolipoprotein diacylglyceryl transferase [Blattabacterium cuenoti]|uniref:prolipoprotein diacylglyceryl transferase n=1 Tax=Blattabacterium cuenoti TaxID=1653831 RepID=UPI001EEBC3C9|nr:prolipoprotein diacylglyceryl transferase [Blattabacterium cuenoti]